MKFKDENRKITPGRIAVIKPTINSIYEMSLVSAVESHLSDIGANLAVLTAENDNVKVVETIMDVIKTGWAGAIITVNVKPQEIISRHCEAARIPLVMIDGGEAVYTNTINIDDYHSGFTAVDYLIKSGRKKIVVTSGDPKHGYSQEMRLLGCRQAFYENQVSESRYSFLNYFLYSREDGIAAFGDIIKEKPDAVFCANGDNFAIGFMEEAMENRVSIPDNIAVVGHDDIGLSGVLGLTTMRQPVGLMGERAVEIIADIINEKTKTPVSEVFKADLIKRQSA